MSIFTHTFPRYVRKQLEDREGILTIGKSLSENRFAKQGRYPAGAFYTNTVEKQCVLRMCSGVDLSEEGEKNILTGKTEKDNWRGPNLAKNWILEGGMPDPNIVTEANIDALTAAKKKSASEAFDDLKEGDIASFTPRGGFTNQPSGKSAYGDPSTRSDAGDGFGIVPMPGIIDAKIKVKSAYGSLREAEVNFVCHNRRQLEILELLYMRPGYTILLEWGWTPHIKTTTLKDGKEGSIIKSSDFFVMNEFFDPNQTFSGLNRAVLAKKMKSGGNYDAMVGYIKNFEIKVREDGGYDCMTSIISMGELLEGLKGQRTFPGIKSKEDDETINYDNFEVYMMALKQKMKIETEVDEFNDQPDWWKWIKSNIPGMSLISTTYSDIAEMKSNPFGDHDISSLITTAFTNMFSPGKGLEFYPEGDDEQELIQAKLEEWQAKDQEGVDRDDSGLALAAGLTYFFPPAAAIWVARREINYAIKKTSVAKERLKSLDAADVIDHFLLHKGETLGLGKEGDASLGKSQHSYIRWDLLCEIMNSFVLDNATGPDNGDGKGPIKKELAKIAYTLEGEESPDDIGVYLDYASFAFTPGTKIPIKLMEDSATEEGSSQNQGLGEELIDLSDIMDGSLNPEICLFPHQIHAGTDPENTRKKLGTVLLGKSKWRDVDASNHVSATNRSIGLIYINVDYLLETYREMRYDSNGGDNEKWSILSFMKKVWEDDITGACAGTHNFVFQMPNSVGRVIDVAFDGTAPPDTHTIQIQGQNSIVRDFNFNTTIDKKLSSTIAIAAQSPKSISNLDQLSFAAFNKNIENRFVQQKMGTKEAREHREKTEKDVQSLASQLYNYHLSIVSDGGKDNKKKNQTVNVENAIQKVLSLQKMVIELTLTYPLKCSKYDKEVYTVDINKDESGYEEGKNNTRQEGCEGDSNKDHPNAGLKRRTATISKSSIIPLKFNAKMDGIGGIVIGNIFKLPKDKLPKGYNGDEVAFVIMGVNHQISKGQDWVTEISGQLILLANNKNQTSMGSYTATDLKNHLNSGPTFDKSVTPTFTVIEGISYKNRSQNAAKLVKYFDNNYTDSVLGDVKLSPGGNKSPLSNFLTEKVGSSDGTDTLPQLDSGGDISPQLAEVAIKVFKRIKQWTDNPPGTNKNQEWTGVNSPDPTYKIRNAGKNPYHITVTGGNDAWHHKKNPNSNHCQGNGLDFVVTPDAPKYRAEIERILQKFAVANKGSFRYINEYDNASSHASGNHWHITYYPGKIGNDGKKELNAARDLANAGKLWSTSWGESESDFKINVSSYVATQTADDGVDYSTQGCFKLGTPIEMFDGTKKNIENIKKGDIIKSYRNGKYTSGIVTKHLTHPINDVIPVAHLGDIIGSVDHPIFINNKWYEISKAPINKEITYMFIDNWYNLEVDGHVINDSDHNYIINGYIMSGLGDHEVLNNTFQRQTIYNTTINY